jgi:CBS domain-containing protein
MTDLLARDLMQSDIITLSPDTPVLDIHRMFVEEEIHGAPVVDDDGVVRGVVSSLDLLRIVRDELEPGAGATTPSYFRDELPYSGPDWGRIPEDFQDRLHDLTASDAMSRELVSVTPSAPAAEIAKTMRQHRIHRVLVIDDKELVGVITTFDLLQALQVVKTARGRA